MYFDSLNGKKKKKKEEMICTNDGHSVFYYQCRSPPFSCSVPLIVESYDMMMMMLFVDRIKWRIEFFVYFILSPPLIMNKLIPPTLPWHEIWNHVFFRFSICKQSNRVSFCFVFSILCDRCVYRQIFVLKMRLLLFLFLFLIIWSDVSLYFLPVLSGMNCAWKALDAGT